MLLENDATRQWCAYGSETRWKKDRDRTEALAVGSVTYADGHIAQITVTEEGESGDWIVKDQYSLARTGDITSLLRRIHVLPGRRSVTIRYRICKRKAIETARVEKDLSTGAVLTRPEAIWLPDYPIRTRVEQFPYAAMFKLGQRLLSGRHCVSEAARKH